VLKSSSLLKIPSALKSPIASDVDVDMGKTDSTDEPIKSHRNKSNFFLSKAIPAPKAKPKFLSKTQERKFNTFFKIQLPKMPSKDLDEDEAEVVASFKLLTGLLWGANPQLLIYPWVDSTANRPLKKGGLIPKKHQDRLKVYADNIYLEQLKSPWLKLRIGHAIDEESFDDNKFKASLMQNDMNFYKEKLQTKLACCTRWLLGLPNTTFNPGTLKLILNSFQNSRTSQSKFGWNRSLPRGVPPKRYLAKAKNPLLLLELLMCGPAWRNQVHVTKQ
jgi:hypothetical protein